MRIHTATRFRERLLGLLARPRLQPGEALLLRPCNSVHTCFMRYELDIVFVDAEGVVLKLVTGLRPWRAAACWSAKATLELAAGQAAALHIQPGQRLALPAPGVPSRAH